MSVTVERLEVRNILGQQMLDDLGDTAREYVLDGCYDSIGNAMIDQGYLPVRAFYSVQWTPLTMGGPTGYAPWECSPEQATMWQVHVTREAIPAHG